VGSVVWFRLWHRWGGAAPLPLLDLLGNAGSRGDETMKPAIPLRGRILPRTAFGRVVTSCLAPEDL
jgi:hypothetical protein